MNYNLSKIYYAQPKYKRLLICLYASIILFFSTIYFVGCNLAKGQQPNKQQPPTPVYIIQGDANYMNTLIRLINKAQQATYNSKLTASEAMPIIDSLSLFTNNFIQQFNYQDSVRLAVAKPKSDTTSKYK